MIRLRLQPYPDSKVHGANMVPTWVLSVPDGPHVGPMNLAIRVRKQNNSCWSTFGFSVMHVVCSFWERERVGWATWTRLVANRPVKIYHKYKHDFIYSLRMSGTTNVNIIQTYQIITWILAFNSVHMGSYVIESGRHFTRAMFNDLSHTSNCYFLVSM